MANTELYNLDYYLTPNNLFYMYDPFRMHGYVAAIQEIGAHSVLDVGCGNNLIMPLLRVQGYDAIGVDFSTDSRADVVADATALPFRRNRFDLAVTFDVLEHLTYDQIHAAISEMRRVARRQAHVICFDSMHGKADDAYHVTLKDGLWWLNEFSKHGLGVTLTIEIGWRVSTGCKPDKRGGTSILVF